MNALRMLLGPHRRAKIVCMWRWKKEADVGRYIEMNKRLNFKYKRGKKRSAA